MKRLVMSLLVFVLLASSVSALEITGLEFLEFLSHGEPIGAISTGRVPNIDMKIIVTGDDFTLLRADISGLNRNDAIVDAQGYRDTVVHASDCEQANDTFTCYIRRIIFLLPSDTVVMPITLYNDTNSTYIEEVYVFDIDNTAPNITDLRTETCLNTTCFIPSNQYAQIRIQFGDERATFEKKIVRYSLGDQKHFVHTCEDMTCYGRAKTTCRSGQRIALKILPDQTMDDAYNILANDMRIDLFCDSEKPTLQNYTIGTDNTNYVKIGDDMVVTVNVTEDLGEVTIEGNFSEFGGGMSEGACEKKGETWFCRVTTGVTGEQPYTGNAKIYIKDTAGNVLEQTVTKNILGLDSEVVVDEWEIGTVQGMPGTLNTDVVIHTTSDIKVYYKLPFQPKYGELEVLEISKACKNAEGENISVFSKFELMNAFQGTTMPFLVGTVANRQYDSGTYKVECTLNIRSKRGQFYHLNYEQENVTLSLTLAPGGNAKEKIKEEIISIMDSWLMSDAMDGLAITSKLLRKSCSAGMSFNIAAKGFNDAYKVIAPPLEAADEVTKASVAEADEKVNEGSSVVLDIVKDSCAFVTCETSFNKGEDIMQETLCNLKGMETLATISGASSGGASCKDTVNGKNSVFVAMANLCLTDTMTHLDTLRNIKYNKAQCLTDGYTANIPSYVCEDTSALLECKFYTGAVLNTVPYTAMTKIAMEKVQDGLNHPWSFAPWAACRVVKWVGGTHPVAHSSCTFLAKTSEIYQIVKTTISQLMQALNLGTLEDPRFGEYGPSSKERINQQMAVLDS